MLNICLALHHLQLWGGTTIDKESIIEGQIQAGFSVLQADNAFTWGGLLPLVSFCLVGHKTWLEPAPEDWTHPSLS